MEKIEIFLLDSFSVGAFTMFLWQSILLFMRGRNNKARRVLSYVYLLYAIACMVRVVAFQLDFVPSAFPYFNIYTIIIGSYIIILSFLYPIEAMTPGWLNKTRTLLFFLPIVFITFAFFLGLKLLHEDIEFLESFDDVFGSITHFNVWFRLVFVVVSTIYVVVLVRLIFNSEERYNKWLHNMYADRESMDISWMCYYALFILLIFLAWLSNIFWNSPWVIIVHLIVVIVGSCFLFYKAIFHRSPYPENFFLESLNEQKAEELNADKLLMPIDPVINLSDQSFHDKIPEYVNLIKKWMDEEKPYLYSDFKLTDVTRILPLNRSYLSRVFNEGFGQSFSDVVRGYRIEYAKRILEEHGDLPMVEVAEQCGFSSDIMFFRVFIKMVGMTPTAYKASRNA